MFYQIFLSPQVKQCAITTYKHGMYELTHKLGLRAMTLTHPVEKLLRLTFNGIYGTKMTPQSDDTHPVEKLFRLTFNGIYGIKTFLRYWSSFFPKINQFICDKLFITFTQMGIYL